MPAWVSGVTSARRFLKDIARVLVTANKDANGEPDPANNWSLVYPNPEEYGGSKLASGITLQPDPTLTIYTAPWPYTVWDSSKPVVVYLNGAVVSETLYTLNPAQGQIVFNVPNAQNDVVTADFYFIDEGLIGALDAIQDRFVLKTTTTPVQPDPGQEYSYEPDRQVSELTMYFEMRQPERVINPDSGVPYYTSVYGNQVGTRENIFYVESRLFDRLNSEGDGPAPRVYNPDGTIADYGAHYSEWAKLSWALDWEERRVDELDDTPGSEDLGKGIILYPTEVTTADGDMPVYFWVVTDNDGFVLVVQGDKGLAQKYALTSFLYVGKIDPVEGAQVADIGGNFAIASSSSTVPAWISLPPDQPPVLGDPVEERDAGTLSDYRIYSYILTYTTDGGESVPSEIKYVVVRREGTGTKQNVAIRIPITVPEGATSWRLYRQVYNSDNESSFNQSSKNNYSLYKLIIESFDPTVTEVLDDGSYDEGSESPLPVGRPVRPVVRDASSGAIVSVRMPATWGPNTATGVTDIAMYKSRSGAYFQRHVAAFQSGEHFATVADIGRQPSAWTGKFHVSPIYVAHPIEGWRGQLRHLLAVFDHGIIDGDELVLNKDQPNEERYRYFKINAPFTFFQSSPSERHAIALRKY